MIDNNMTPNNQLSPENPADDEPQPTYISPSPPPKMPQFSNGAVDGSPLENRGSVNNSVASLVPMKTDPNNTLPFIIQKQQML